MHIKKIISVTCLCIITTNVYSSTKTRDVYEWCSNLEKIQTVEDDVKKVDLYKAGLCDGFFSGFREGEYLQYVIDNLKKLSAKDLTESFSSNRAWCEPKDGVTLQQRYLIFNKYVKEHPESLHKDAYLTITLAMKPHFPCKK